jgi:sterol desaturase/sphingolipid hydroxylase (fatty acid hydroxylase superfamily)
MFEWTAIPFPVRQLLAQAATSVKYTTWYYLVVVAVFFTAWLCWRRWPARRARLQAKPVAGRQIGREILTTVGSILIIGNVMPLLFFFGFGRYTQYYKDVESRGWLYLCFSILLMMLIQDTYFYWTHRLMHQRRLFRWIHRTHHRSTNPNPWTTYSVGPIEAIINSGASVLILVLIPSTGIALVAFSWINTVYAVYGHLGYELYPRSFGKHWLGRWINTSVAHNTHHAKVRYNYGWYFLFWDRAMGTLDPKYSERFRRRVTTQLE